MSNWMACRFCGKKLNGWHRHNNHEQDYHTADYLALHREDTIKLLEKDKARREEEYATWQAIGVALLTGMLMDIRVRRMLEKEQKRLAERAQAWVPYLEPELAFQAHIREAERELEREKAAWSGSR